MTHDAFPSPPHNNHPVLQHSDLADVWASLAQNSSSASMDGQKGISPQWTDQAIYQHQMMQVCLFAKLLSFPSWLALYAQQQMQMMQMQQHMGAMNGWMSVSSFSQALPHNTINAFPTIHTKQYTPSRCILQWLLTVCTRQPLQLQQFELDQSTKGSVIDESAHFDDAEGVRDDEQQSDTAHDEQIAHEQDMWKPWDGMGESAGTTHPPNISMIEGYKEAWDKLSRRLEALNDVPRPYDFQSVNHFFTEHAASTAGEAEAASATGTADGLALFDKGMELFTQGDIPEAILAFEASLQVNADNDECWRMLGVSHTENDDDKLAIQCLRRAVDIDAYNLEALISLGASYVNEMEPAKALDTLKAWVAHNPRFEGLQYSVDEYSDGTLMDEVMQLMTAAAAWAPDDVDVMKVCAPPTLPCLALPYLACCC